MSTSTDIDPGGETTAEAVSSEPENEVKEFTTTPPINDDNVDDSPTDPSLTPDTNNTNKNNNNNNNNVNWRSKLFSRTKLRQNPEENDAFGIMDNDTTSSTTNPSKKLWGVGTAPSTSQEPQQQYQQQSSSTSELSLTYDSFSFAPIPPNFVPLSSCDELEPPTFDQPSELKISNNFTKLIINAKKVDQIRNAAANANRKGSTDNYATPAQQKQAKQQKGKQQQQNGIIDTSATLENILDAKELESLSVEEAQKKLIAQLKLGLDFLTKQNKQLSTHCDKLQGDLTKERQDHGVILQKKQEEVEERNFKLAVLEQTFMALNNPTKGKNPSDESGSTDADADVNVNVNGGADLTQENQEEPPSQTTPILSSIVQVDKAYFTDLEKTAKRQKNAIETLESENKNLTNQVTTYTQDLERKERTITNLELTLKQGRETRFNKSSIKKSSKSKHRRRMTESVIITNKTTTGGNSSAQSQSEDDYSISVDGENNTTDKEQIATDTDSHTHIDTQKEIADAVSVALEKKEEEHSSTMEVLSHQLDLKDKIISRHEMKIYSLLNKNNDPFHNPVAKKQISQDAMVRNIAVTNELMDRSINRLEKMMNQLELIEKEKRTDLADEISPLRRVGTKVSLVHEELKVAIKLIEQKINNDFRKIKQDSDQEGEKDDGDIGEECSGQKSCEGGGENITTPSLTSKPCKSSIADQISDVFTEAMKALKETETEIKKQIDYLKDELQKFEFEMATKQDTIEALELACSEQVQNIRKMQDEIDELKSGLTQV